MNYATPRDRIRWMAAVNRGTKTIPGFGLCSTKLADISDFELQEDVEGQVCWRVFPCAETEAYQLQDATQLWVNGPTAIPPGGYGKVAQDWPMQVLHNGAKDGLPNGYECGPPAPTQLEPKDAFAVWSHGNAFTCHSHDASSPLGTGPFHTVWISPNTRKALPVHASATFSGTHRKETTELLFLGSPTGTTAPLSTYPGDVGIEAYGNGFKLATNALLWIAFSGTLTSADATEGDLLGMRVTVDGEETYLYAYRSFVIDTDYPATTFRTNENVASAGLLRVLKGQLVELVVGTSVSYQTTVSAGIFSLHRVYTPYDRVISSSLHTTGP